RSTNGYPDTHSSDPGRKPGVAEQTTTDVERGVISPAHGRTPIRFVDARNPFSGLVEEVTRVHGPPAAEAIGTHRSREPDRYGTTPRSSDDSSPGTPRGQE